MCCGRAVVARLSSAALSCALLQLGACLALPGAEDNHPAADGGTKDASSLDGCFPVSCLLAKAECGLIANGCGVKVDCGPCPAPQSCGTTSNKCECTPKTCAELGADCGMLPDGCGNNVDCGTCAAPQTCGGGGSNKCGSGVCVPTTCAAVGKNCGIISDGCGSPLDCGNCPAGQICGSGGIANVCGCSPTTCAAQGKNCGPISDGCGGTLDCGNCVAPNVCTANVCGCAPIAQSTGLTKPGVGANDASVGTVAWYNVNWAIGLANYRAKADLTAGEISNFLVVSEFGFAVPANATITGIQVSVERMGADHVQDAQVRLLKSGGAVGANKATAVEWATSDEIVTYGGPADLWGTTWTPAEIDDVAFGVAIAATTNYSGSTQSARVDLIQVGVFFALPCS